MDFKLLGRFIFILISDCFALSSGQSPVVTLNDSKSITAQKNSLNQISPGDKSDFHQMQKKNLRLPPSPLKSEGPLPNLKSSLLKASPSSMKNQGGVGDGGGSGIACFDRWEKGISESSLDEEGRLLPEYRDRVGQVWVTDLLEIIQGPHKGAIVYRNFKPEETIESYIQSIVEEKVGRVSARFADLMRKALQEVNFKKWIPVRGIPAIDDVGRPPNIIALKVRNQNYCAMVQIARRKIVVNEDGSKKVFVEYDPDLYEKLESVDTMDSGQLGRKQQALLQIHEAIYFLAAQLDHENSVASRALSRILMAESLSVYSRAPTDTNFDFLYLLNSSGFLDRTFFGVPSEDSTGLFYQSALADILDRMKVRNQNEATCDWNISSETESRFPCELSFLGQRLHFGYDFVFLYTTSELEQSDPRLAVFLYGLARHAEFKAPLTNLMRHLSMRESRPTLFVEEMLLGNSQMRALHMKDLCSSLKKDREIIQGVEKYFSSISRVSVENRYSFPLTNEFKVILDVGSKYCEEFTTYAFLRLKKSKL